MKALYRIQPPRRLVRGVVGLHIEREEARVDRDDTRETIPSPDWPARVLRESPGQPERLISGRRVERVPAGAAGKRARQFDEDPVAHIRRGEDHGPRLSARNPPSRLPRASGSTKSRCTDQR